jgi:hypothetical protein
VLLLLLRQYGCLFPFRVRLADKCGTRNYTVFHEEFPYFYRTTTFLFSLCPEQ